MWLYNPSGETWLTTGPWLAAAIDFWLLPHSFELFGVRQFQVQRGSAFKMTCWRHPFEYRGVDSIEYQHSIVRRYHLNSNQWTFSRQQTGCADFRSAVSVVVLCSYSNLYVVEISDCAVLCVISCVFDTTLHLLCLLIYYFVNRSVLNS